MKICLYLELSDYFIKNKIGTGVLSSYKNQKTLLRHLNIPFVENWDESCDILQTNTPWPKSVYLMKKAKRAGQKVIIWSHVTMEDAMQVFWFMPFIAPLFKKYLTYAYGLADVVLCPTPYTRSLLVAYGLPEQKLVVQSNAVDLKKYYQDSGKREGGRGKYGLRGLVVGTVAQVNPRKGTDTFLWLAEKFQNNQFLWTGNFFSKLIVKALPKDLPNNVQFTGFVEDILEAYNSLDIFIFPSYEENQGMAVLEAAACGLPILVRDIPVYQGWLTHGENCLKARTDEEFAQNLKRICEDGPLRAKLKASSLKLAQDESIEVTSAKLRKIYEALV